MPGNAVQLGLLPTPHGERELDCQKIISAVTSGVVPDLFQNNPFENVALFAWDDKLVDVSDVVATQREEYTEAALLSAYCYNRVEKQRSFYGVPYTAGVSANHIWGSPVQRAGYTIEDIPRTWDAFYDFFKGVQKKLRQQGMRNVLRIPHSSRCALTEEVKFAPDSALEGRESKMQRFKSARSAQRFLGMHAAVHNTFNGTPESSHRSDDPPVVLNPQTRRPSQLHSAGDEATQVNLRR